MKDKKIDKKTKKFFSVSRERIRKLNDRELKIGKVRNFNGINVDLPNMKAPSDYEGAKNGIIDGAIWGAEGPTLREAAQRGIGDCWLIAGIDSILSDSLVDPLNQG